MSDEEVAVSSTTHTNLKTYMKGVEIGIINTEKYTFESFQKDENIFRDLYLKYTSVNGSLPLNYEEWLVMNNFGILPDTQESLLQNNVGIQRTSDDKERFVNTVKKGDILINGYGFGGLIGHAAIMMSDDWILEMPGGVAFCGMSSNNRQISKYDWYDKYASDGPTVYRCPNEDVARDAAEWAERTYYNPSGGSEKVIHVKYSITTDVFSTNPSYCSKLVAQAYYFGTGNKKGIEDLTFRGPIIVPTLIPSYFSNPYKLVNMGKF